MNRICRFIASRFLLLVPATFLFGLTLTPSVTAADYLAQGGLGFTTQSPALFGFALSLNRRGDSKNGSWFSDTQLLYHQLNSVSSGGGEDGGTTASVSLQSWELNWFFLLPISGKGSLHYFGGAGIGYGIAKTKENVSSQGAVKDDPTKFFSADDIHYGTLLLKIGMNWNNKSCEGRISSFGGLIGGTLLCGLSF